MTETQNTSKVTTSQGTKEDNFNRDPSTPYFTYTMENKKGKLIEVDYDGYIVGVVNSISLRQSHDWDNLIIITGGTGDGKSSLAEGISALLQWNIGRKLSFDNVCWTSRAFVEKTDREDNFQEVVWWDEAIQGAGGKKMAITKEGDALKSAIVTKRMKRHVYILLIDEIEEYSWKLIKKANAWFHVKSFGFMRGFFECYVKKHKIKRIYTHLKKYKGSMEDDEIKWIKPDKKFGKFKDYRGTFLDEKEYDKKKLEETRQLEEADSKPKERADNPDKQRAIELWKSKEYPSHRQLAKFMNYSQTCISNWLSGVDIDDNKTSK